MRHVLLIAAIAAVALTGCRKKSSPEFYDAQSSYSIIVDRLGDDAYDDDEMQRIKDELHSVPANALEADQAHALLAKIEAESARVANARKGTMAARPTAGNTEAPVFPTIADAPSPEPVAVAPVDAGPAKPSAGMSLDDFKAAWGDCVDDAGEATMPGVADKGVAFAVKDTDACRAKLGVGAGTSYIFIKDKLRGLSQTTRTPGQTTVVDAGTPAPKPAPPAAIPGFPAPTGKNAPPPPAETQLPE